MFMACFVGLTSLQGCGSKESDERTIAVAEAPSVEMERYNKAIQEFGRAHNAVWDWQEPLRVHRLSTMSVQNALIRADSRPIAAKVDVLDIEQEQNRYRLRLHVSGLGTLFSKDHVLLDLRCFLGPNELGQIQKHIGSSYLDLNPISEEPPFMVAAQIHEVQAHHKLIHSKDYTPIPYIEFVAHGECVQFKYLGVSPNVQFDPTKRSIVPGQSWMDRFRRFFAKGKE
jgi:hypothetical protein